MSEREEVGDMVINGESVKVSDMNDRQIEHCKDMVLRLTGSLITTRTGLEEYAKLHFRQHDSVFDTGRMS